MAETTNDRKIFSLAEVSLSIQKTLSERYKSVFWVKAEMNKLNHYPQSGHCYPDLVEKKDGKVIAQLRSTLWRDDYNRINRDFLRIVRTPLKDGIQMLFCARVLFDPVHGLSLRIMDIDPSFSLGELEREKQETIDHLRSDGVFEQNRNLSMPLVPQRIAIVSVQTSKGYADFLNVIEGNVWGYKIFHVLFPSLLQGDRAVESMLYQLKRIKKVVDHFDAVAIIRGGGGEVGLSCFNNYSLAREIATFPIPVITGIGHATNETVVEIIAHRNSITPTDLANYLLEHFREFASDVERLERAIVQNTRQILRQEKQTFGSAIKLFKSVANTMLLQQRHEIQHISQSLLHESSVWIKERKDEMYEMVYDLGKVSNQFCNQRKQKIQSISFGLEKDVAIQLVHQKNNLQNLARSVDQMNPLKVLDRGYSITTYKGKVIKDISLIQVGDEIDTRLAAGTVKSTVTAKTNEGNE